MFDTSSGQSQFEQLRESVISWLERHDNNPLASDVRASQTVHVLPTYHEGRSTHHHAGLIVVALVGVLLGLSFAAYSLGATTIPSRIIASTLPIPAVLVNGTPVSLAEWQKQTDSLQSFYAREQNKDDTITLPSVDDTKQHVLDRMIDQALIRQLAHRYGLNVATEEVNEQLNKISLELGGREALISQLDELYGWTLQDFRREIVEPLLLKTKVGIALQQDDRLNAQARKKAEEVLKMVKEDPARFPTIAEKYSEDITALSGGDLGYFGKGEMVKEFDAAVTSLEAGQVSELVKTRYGYHIILLEEKLQDEAGNVSQFKARQILIRGVDVDEYLAHMKKEARIWVLVRL